ncbi:ankyrin repeat-containing protein [Apiospora marii]|uniref:Ankyrin repeat-containing protein n=1 Tax=Apiospora marii TaxID=335849 RepID=A0ABR1R8K3_9PEZI
MELEQILRDVMRSDDASDLEGLLEAGVSTETILNDWRDRPLHIMARKGNLRGFQALLKHGVLVDEPNDNNTTPLLTALTNHHVEISLAILDAGANPCSKTKLGKTPLYYAAWGNLLAPIEKLLASGADVNAPDSDGRTPLHMAMQPVRNGKSLSLDSKVLDALLGYGADPTAALYKTALTPLHFLAEWGKSAELERLARKARTLDLFLTSSYELPGATPLLLAAYHGNHVSVQKLLDCGADPNARSPIDTRLPTALWAAFDQKKYGSARKLLDKGADPDCCLSKKFEGISMLHHAATIGDVKAIERLLKYKASVDIKSSKEDTPLMMAVTANQVEAAKLLVENRASVNITFRRYNNATALIQAAKVGSLPMVHLLCRNGANLTHRTPGDNMSAFLQAVSLGHVDCAIYLLALGADIDEQDAVGRRPLHFAASSGRAEVVRWLLSMEADGSVRTSGAETAEGLARQGGHHDIVALLASTE